MAGFEHGKTYKIQSCFDGAVLSLWESKNANGTMLVPWEWHAGANQKWTANKEGAGFRLEGGVQGGNSRRVADKSNIKPDHVQYWDFHGGKNQIWVTTHVVSNKFLIKSLHNETALRNQGRGQHVKCTLADVNDVSQLWTLVPL